MVCASVRVENRRASASGLSPVQMQNHTRSAYKSLKHFFLDRYSHNDFKCLTRFETFDWVGTHNVFKSYLTQFAEKPLKQLTGQALTQCI